MTPRLVEAGRPPLRLLLLLNTLYSHIYIIVVQVDQPLSFFPSENQILANVIIIPLRSREPAEPVVVPHLSGHVRQTLRIPTLQRRRVT